MNSTVQYEKLATSDWPEEGNGPETQTELGNVDDTTSIDSEHLDKIVTVRNDKPFPISRPPAQHRDSSYAAAFMLHLIVVVVFSMVEQNSLQDSLINYGRAGSWASMLMIVTLLGSFFGAVVSFAVGVHAFRDILLASAIPFSFILKICVGNILLIMRSQFSFLGVLVIASAIIDSFWYRSARDNVGFTSALVQMVTSTTQNYGVSFFLFCAFVVSAQTCILLWWGAFFIGVISTISAVHAGLLTIVMTISLYWITQFFHSVVAFVVGGCILWVYLKEENEELKPTGKLILYCQCAVTTSLGSVCKGAIALPFSQTILMLNHWILRRPSSMPATCSFRALASHCLSESLVWTAKRHHRLALCTAAVYGRALCPAAQELAMSHPETLDICVEDSTHFILNATAVAVAGLVAIVFGLIAEHGEGSSWPLFFFVCFYLAYCGVSLSIHVYSSAIDALIVSSAVNPVKFAKENQIVFLRFLRTSESALR